MDDKVIVALKELLAGIAPTLNVGATLPQVTSLRDFRVKGGRLERLGFSLVEAAVTVDAPNAKVIRLGNSYEVLNDVIGLCRFDEDYLVQRAIGGSLLEPDGSTTAATLVNGSLRGYHGGAVMLNYPTDGAAYIHRPGVLPIVESTVPPASIDSPWDTSLAHPKGGYMVSADGVNSLYEAHAMGFGLVLGGDTGVVIFHFDEPVRQELLRCPGLLSEDSMAGDDTICFFLAEDKSLWVITKEGPKRLGFSWLFQSAEYAYLSYVSEQEALFITIYDGTSYTSYVFFDGLSEISVAVLDATYIEGIGAVLLTTDGDLYTMTAADTGGTTDLDWSAWTQDNMLLAHIEDGTARAADLVTEYSDFGIALTKQFTGFDVLSAPFWPVYIRVDSYADGALDAAIALGVVAISTPTAVPDPALDVTRLRVSYWFPLFTDAGAIRVNGFRAHVLSTELKDIYAAKQGEL